MKIQLISASLILLSLTVHTEAGPYLDGQKLRDTLSGRTVKWSDGSKSIYASDGSYTFVGKVKIFGKWNVRGSWVCVLFANGKEECARYLHSRKRLYAQDTLGRRFRAY
jgi:hypothetical protein